MLARDMPNLPPLVTKKATKEGGEPVSRGMSRELRRGVQCAGQGHAQPALSGDQEGDQGRGEPVSRGMSRELMGGRRNKTRGRYCGYGD